MIADVHSHHHSHEAIVNAIPGQKLRQGYLYSTGIHPWNTTGQIDWQQLEETISQSNVVAIGETGLDSIKGAPIKVQRDIFIKHIELSELYAKPLIIHCVRSHQLLVEIKHVLKPYQEWIFHGFRLKPSIAEMMLKDNINLSLGKMFNTDTANIIPKENLLIETDDTECSINEIAEKIASATNNTTEHIIDISITNIKRICKLPHNL